MKCLPLDFHVLLLCILFSQSLQYNIIPYNILKNNDWKGIGRSKKCLYIPILNYQKIKKNNRKYKIIYKYVSITIINLKLTNVSNHIYTHVVKTNCTQSGSDFALALYIICIF